MGWAKALVLATAAFSAIDKGPVFVDWELAETALLCLKNFIVSVVGVC